MVKDEFGKDTSKGRFLKEVRDMAAACSQRRSAPTTTSSMPITFISTWFSSRALEQCRWLLALVAGI